MQASLWEYRAMLARRQAELASTTECYGATVAGTACELPPGHYPATKHLVTYERGWMMWTDEFMADFARGDRQPQQP